MLTPLNSTLFERIANYAAGISDTPIRRAIVDTARLLITEDQMDFDTRLGYVTDKFEAMTKSRFSTALMQAQFQHCADFCYEEAAHREFFSLELPF